MNWRIFSSLVSAALLFVGGSTTALADNYRGHGRIHYNHAVVPYYRHYGHGQDYRWHKQGDHGYYDGWKYHGEHYRYGQRYRYYHYDPYRWHGGPFFGGNFFLPGWGVVFGGHGRG
jgi:hypothetical protein